MARSSRFVGPLLDSACFGHLHILMPFLVSHLHTHTHTVHCHYGGGQTGVQNWKVLSHTGAQRWRDGWGTVDILALKKKTIYKHVCTGLFHWQNDSFSDFDHGLNDFCQKEQEDELRQRRKKKRSILKRIWIKALPYRRGLCRFFTYRSRLKGQSCKCCQINLITEAINGVSVWWATFISWRKKTQTRSGGRGRDLLFLFFL